MRYHCLDNLRGLLMVLGIVLHTCAALSESQYWMVSYKQSASWADAINIGIHYFRMPLFFIISGFFTVYVFQKKGLWQSLGGRAQRILIPFVCTLLTLNMIEQWLVNYINGYSNQTFINVSHLWFLVNLFAYLVVLVVFYKLLQWFANTRLIDSVVGQYLLVALCPLIYIGVLSINYVVEILYEPALIINSLYVLLEYLHLYILGALIALNPALLDKIMRSWPVYTTLAIIACCTLYFAQAPNKLLDGGSTLSKVFFEYINSISQIVVCLSLLSLSKMVLSRSGGALKRVADASYTIYLFHHLVIILLIVLLNTLDFTLAPAVVFALVISAAYIITVNIHKHIVLKSSILHYWYNGKK